MATIAQTLRAELHGSPWQPVTVWRPRRINGRWYRPGERVYRRFLISPGGGYWQWGDVFDKLRGQP